MKKLLTFATIVVAMVLSSCEFDDSEIWDKLKDHEKRITALEELCKQMNTNITSLQTLVNAHEKRDYITNVSVIRKDGEEIGYTISFANSNTITIYHGQDGTDGADGQDGANGKDGQDGKDGYTPKIGIKKDTDDVYYWTLDGEWLLDGDGNKVKAVGTDGENGQDGANGVTPRLKIENDYWYVSYDEGVTWIEVGKAIDDNSYNSVDGLDSVFSSVIQDDEYVYFNLTDGTMITLPKHDKENIQFEDLLVKAICCKNWDTNNDGELSYAEAAAVNTIGTAFQENANIIAFTELKYFTGLIDIESRAFYGCSSLWKIVLPENICTIGSFAFSGCSSLTNVVIPDSVVTIGSSAFEDCSSLTNIIIPNNIASIEYATFNRCTSLTSVVIPDNITLVSRNAFSKCLGLMTLTIGNGVTKIEEGVFSGCTQLSTIYCKPITPPAVSYYTSMLSTQDSRCTFPENSNMTIYVPSSAVDAYKYEYGNAKPSYVVSGNWYYYRDYIKPYDFEE